MDSFSPRCVELRIKAKDHCGGLFLEKKIIYWEYLSFIQGASQPWAMAGIRSYSQLLEEKENNLSILEKHDKEML